MKLKKLLTVLLLVFCVSMLSACCMRHEWKEATCTEPKTCQNCEKTEGDAAGHVWQDATCNEAKTCSICGEKEGNALGHKWSDWEIIEGTSLSENGNKVRRCNACGEENHQELSARDVFDAAGLTSNQQEVYTNEKRRFCEILAPREYIELVKTAENLSATPYFAIGKNAFLAAQDITSYNTDEDYFVIMDMSGNILKKYDNYIAISLSNPKSIGKYTFIVTQFDPDKYDIVDENGKVVNQLKNLAFSNSFYKIIEVSALGNDYFLFSETLEENGTEQNVLYIMKPDGQYCRVQLPAKHIAEEIVVDLEKIEYGKLCDNLFYLHFENALGTWAWYTNTSGHVVIDLSSKTTNYHITKLGDFSEGVATIEFKGADNKNYVGTIDTQGNFVEEPMLKS